MAKKRKKKVYTTPKKIKHTSVNVKMNMLKIIDNPKCKNCNNFLAVHSDRYMCGYCNISIPIN